MVRPQHLHLHLLSRNRTKSLLSSLIKNPLLPMKEVMAKRTRVEMTLLQLMASSHLLKEIHPKRERSRCPARMSARPKSSSRMSSIVSTRESL